MYGEGALVEGSSARSPRCSARRRPMFAPSGVMAQLAAVRLWSEAAGVARFGMHPTSHLAHHEAEAYAALLHCHGVPVGNRLRPIVAADPRRGARDPGLLARRAADPRGGGQLPSWDELEALKAAAGNGAVPLHMDGARLWESAAYYGRDYAHDRRRLRLGLRFALQGHRRLRRRRARRRRLASSPRRVSGGVAWAARCTT
jgi:threonine aldolase